MSNSNSSLMKRSFWILGLLLSSCPYRLACFRTVADALGRSSQCHRPPVVLPDLREYPLDVCPTQACHDWRELIRQMLAAGKSEAEIKQYFVDHYGARVLSEPPAAGLNWLVYVVPRSPSSPAFSCFLWPFAPGNGPGPALPRPWLQIHPRRKKIPARQFPEPPLRVADDEYAARFEEQLRKSR